MSSSLEGDKEKLLWRKVTVVGPKGVGKTSLIKQFCESKFTSTTRDQPTIGADYGHKHCLVGGQKVEITFWDLAGGIEFKEIRRHLLPETELCLLVFELSNLTTGLVVEWIQEVNQYVVPSKMAIFINKMDLANETTIKDNVMLVKEIASKHNINVFLTTATTNSDLTDTITSLLLQSLKDDP